MAGAEDFCTRLQNDIVVFTAGEAIPAICGEGPEQCAGHFQCWRRAVDGNRLAAAGQPELFDQQRIPADMVRVFVREDDGIQVRRVKAGGEYALEGIAAAVHEHEAAGFLDGQHRGGSVRVADGCAGAEEMERHELGVCRRSDCRNDLQSTSPVTSCGPRCRRLARLGHRAHPREGKWTGSQRSPRRGSPSSSVRIQAPHAS